MSAAGGEVSGLVAAGAVLASAGIAAAVRKGNRHAAVRERLTPRGRRCTFVAPPALARAVDAALVPMPPETAAALWAGTIALGSISGLLLLGPVGAACLWLGAMAAPAASLHLLRHRRDDRRDAQLPDALERIAAAVRTGSSLRQATASAGEGTPDPLGAELREVAAMAARGVPLADALDGWAASAGRSVALAAAALAVGAGTGGALARAVDGVACTLRDRRAVAGELRALATQARSSAAVMAVAPLAFSVVALAADARSARFLFRSSAGVLCLTAGLVLDAAGAAWMARITRPPA